MGEFDGMREEGGKRTPRTVIPLKSSVGKDEFTGMRESDPIHSAITSNVNAVKSLNLNANTEATAYNNSKKSGLSVNIARDKPEEFTDDFDGLESASPETKKYLAKSASNVAISRGDFQSLNLLDRVIKGVPEAYSSGRLRNQIADLRWKQLMGEDTPELTASIETLKSQQTPELIGKGFFERGLLGASEQANLLLRTIAAGAKGGALGAAGGAGTAFVLGQLGPQVALLEEPLTMTVGAIKGYGFGSRAGSAKEIFKLEAAGAYDEFLDIRDVNDKPIDRDIIRIASFGVGAANAGLEMIGLGALLKTVPGGAAILGRITSSQVKTVLTRKTVQAGLKEIAKRFAGAVTAETITEIAQEAVNIIAAEIVKDVSEEKQGTYFRPFSKAKASERLQDIAKRTIESTTILAGAPSVINITKTIATGEESQTWTNDQKRINKAVNDTQTKNISPDHMEEILNEYGQDTPAYISSEGVTRFYQSDPATADAILLKLGVDAEQAKNNASKGQDTEIVVSKMQSQLTPEEFGLIEEDIKQSPGSYTGREITDKKATEDIENSTNLLKEDIAQKEKVDAEITRLESEIKASKLIDSKLAEDAPVILKGLAERLQLNGLDPVEQLKNITIKRTPFREFVQRGKELFQNRITKPPTGNIDFKRVEGLGFTDNLDEAGYITPEGKLIDLSGKEEGLQEGKKNLEHRVIGNKMLGEQEFQAIGNIRIDVSERIMELHKTPTNRQIKVISKIIKELNGKIIFDITSGLGELIEFKDPQFEDFYRPIKSEHIEYQTGTRASKIIKDIKSFYTSQLFQAREGKPRGAISIEGERKMIELFDGADLSTVLHEIGHVALLEYSALEATGEANVELVDDMKVIREWVGAKEGAEFTRDQSEQFARGFEAYLMEGKAPTTALKAAFERFKHYLTSVYKSALALDVKLTKPVRQVFDRMLTANIEVESAAQENGFVVKTEAEMNDLGMVDADKIFAKKLIEIVTNKAEEQLTKDRNKGLRSHRKRWSAEARGEVLVEEPIYNTINEIVRGAIVVNPDELEVIRKEVDFGEAVYRMPVRDKNGDIIKDKWILGGGGFPEYFRDRGFTKENVLHVLNKAIEGKQLAKGQQKTLNVLVEAYREETLRQYELAGGDVAALESEYLISGETRFDRDEFVVRYGEDAIDNLINPAVMVDLGTPIDEVAISRGYENADTFIEDMLNKPTYSEAVDKRLAEKQAKHDALFEVEDYFTDIKQYRQYQALIARYLTGKGVDQKAIDTGIQNNVTRWEKEAAAQLKEEQTELTGGELTRAINDIVTEKIEAFRERKLKPKALTTDLLKRFARETMAAKTVKEARRVDKFLSAMKKAASDERRAILRKDWGSASEANEIGRFNYEMASLSGKIRTEVDVVLARAKRIGKPKKTETVDFKHKEAILHLIARYDMANLVPKEPAVQPDYTALFEGDDFGNDGFPKPEFIDTSIDDYRDLRLEQFRELDNAIRYLEGQGRIGKDGLLSDGVTFVQDIVDESVAVQDKGKGKKVYEQGSIMRTVSDVSRKFFAWIDSYTFIAKKLDGFTNVGKDGVKGPVEIYAVDPIKDSGDNLIIDGTELQTQLEPHINQLSKTIRKWNKATKFGERIRVDGAPVPFLIRQDGRTTGWKGHEIFSVILNTGNRGDKSNYQNLQSGYIDLTDAAIEQLKDMLTTEDMDAVQGIWDTINSLFAKADAQHLKIKNYKMTKVEATPFVFKGKEYKGGYYPIKHDSNLSFKVADRGAVEDFFNNEGAAISVPYTKSGSTIQRVNGVALPILLDLSVIDNHFKNTLQYIHFTDAVTDADKITRHPDFRESAVRILGKDVYGAIRPALQHIANPKRAGLDVAGAQGVEWMRGLSTMYILAHNTGVAIKQPLSTFGAIRDMGIKAYIDGFSSVMMSPSAHYDKMIDLSPYMKDRLTSFDRELKSAFLGLSKEKRGIYFGDTKVTWQDVKNFGFWQIRLADTVTVMPIWNGAFNDKLLPDQSNMKEAVRYADDIVRNSQPSAQPLDLSTWQRDAGAIRLFSQFQTFTVGKYGQRQRLFYNAWKNGKLSTVDYAWTNFMDSMLPLVAINFLQSVLWGTDLGDEEEQSIMLRDILLGWAFMGVPLAGSITRSLNNYGDAFDSPVIETANKLVRSAWAAAGALNGFENDREREKALWGLAHTVSILGGVPVDKIVGKAQKGAEQKKGVPGAKYLVPAPKNRR